MPGELKDEIPAAVERLRGVAIATPLVRLAVDDAPAEVYLKLECLHPSGSFKIRTAGNQLLALSAAERERGIYTASGSTFRWGGRYHASMNQRDTLFTELGVFEGFEPTLSQVHSSSPYVFLANIHPSLQLSVLEQASAVRFCAMDTMNFWIEGTPDELAKVLASVNGLVINDEEALQLTEAKGGEVTVVTYGPDHAEAALRDCLARGAHQAVHILGGEATLGDSFTIAKVLAAALKDREYDLVLCGFKGVGTDCGQVGQMLAELLDHPHVANVSDLEVGDGSLTASSDVVVGTGKAEIQAAQIVGVAAARQCQDVSSLRVRQLE